MLKQEVKLRKGMMAFIAVTMLFCVLIALVPLALSIASLVNHNDTIVVSLALFTIACLMGALCGYLLFWSGAKLLTRRPGLFFDQDGFIDISHFTSVGFVPWREVSRIEQQQIGKFQVISIFVTEPDKYLAAGNFVRRYLVRSAAKQSGAPITIAEHYLKINHEELKGLFDEWFTKSQNQ